MSEEIEDNDDVVQPSESFLTTEPSNTLKLDIERDVLTQAEFVKQTNYISPHWTLTSFLRTYYKNFNFHRWILKVIPILAWLPQYSMERDFIPDFISGLTVGVTKVAKGLAIGMLSGMDPTIGLYVSIVPGIIYVILGSSKHVSIGTFNVSSLMVKKAIHDYAKDPVTGETIYTDFQIASAMAMMTGFVLLFMCLMRLGTLTALLSEPLINGFIIATAVVVIIGELPDAMGIPNPPRREILDTIFKLIDVCKTAHKTNVATMLTFLGGMAILIFVQAVVKPYAARRCSYSVPGELIVVIIGIVVSGLLDLNGVYDVDLIGGVTPFLPGFALPPLALLPVVIVESIALAVVSFTVLMFVGLMFANEFAYEIRPNQELFATGVGNVLGGCFSCLPLGCTLVRTTIQIESGGVTQIASLISIAVVVATILWAGSFFDTLPKSILAAVIVFTLYPMMGKATKVKTFAKQGHMEFLTWFITFAIVILIDIDVGLFSGIAFSMFRFYKSAFQPYHAPFGTVAEVGGVYLNVQQHHKAEEVPNMKIFHYTGSLNFVNKYAFQKAIYQAVTNDADAHVLNIADYRVFILDMSSLSHIDVAGCRMLSNIQKEMAKIELRMFLASPTDNAYDTILHSIELGQGPFEMFPTVHDAVIYGKALLRDQTKFI